jgi:two-component system, cell cycle response regulator DivK
MLSIFVPHASRRITACRVSLLLRNAPENLPMQGDAPSRPARRVLIVEDNELNLKLLRDILEAHGYATITARDGGTALALARDERPDLILMDLQLPDISGYDAVGQLKGDDATRSIPIAAVTAFAMAGDERKALTAGCDAYVAKPIVLRHFLEIVARLAGTGKGPAPDAARREAS